MKVLHLPDLLSAVSLSGKPNMQVAWEYFHENVNRHTKQRLGRFISGFTAKLAPIIEREQEEASRQVGGKLGGPAAKRDAERVIINDRTAASCP